MGILSNCTALISMNAWDVGNGNARTNHFSTIELFLIILVCFLFFFAHRKEDILVLFSILHETILIAFQWLKNFSNSSVLVWILNVWKRLLYRIFISAFNYCHKIVRYIVSKIEFRFDFLSGISNLSIYIQDEHLVQHWKISKSYNLNIHNRLASTFV